MVGGDDGGSNSAWNVDYPSIWPLGARRHFPHVPFMDSASLQLNPVTAKRATVLVRGLSRATRRRWPTLQRCGTGLLPYRRRSGVAQQVQAPQNVDGTLPQPGVQGKSIGGARPIAGPSRYSDKRSAPTRSRAVSQRLVSGIPGPAACYNLSRPERRCAA